MVENKLDDVLDRTAHRFAALGISFYDYLSMTGKTLEDVRDERREEALRLVKASLALSAVAEAEGLSVTEEELQEELERIAQNYSADVEDIKGRINTEPLREDLITRKTIKLIADSAVRLSADDNKGGETQ
jgi:trigger factor